jgi:hypothetical protein
MAIFFYYIRIFVRTSQDDLTGPIEFLETRGNTRLELIIKNFIKELDSEILKGFEKDNFIKFLEKININLSIKFGLTVKSKLEI